ncbi:hypothetical protein KKC17_01305 [Patescibacteria group bacterium]|nr:hypothetical protein [Patescibacteria group bacterium]
MPIIIGSIITALGAGLIWGTEWLIRNFGGVAWAEQHLGSDGGSRLFYKLIGFILIIIGFATITGLFEPLLLGLLSPLFGSLK